MDKILTLLIVCASLGAGCAQPSVLPGSRPWLAFRSLEKHMDLPRGGSAELNAQHLPGKTLWNGNSIQGMCNHIPRPKQDFRTTEVSFEPGRVKLSIKEKNRNKTPFSNPSVNNKDIFHRAEYHSHVTASQIQLQHSQLGKCHSYSLIHLLCPPRSLITQVC